MGFANKVQETGKGLNAIFVIAFLGLIWLMIFGNLSGNLGFDSGTTGANNTETIISNITDGTVVFYGFAPTWFTILAIVLLIVLLLSLLAIVLKIAGSGKSKGGFGE